MSHVYNNFKHFLSFSKFHNCVDFSCKDINIQLIHFDDVFMTELMMIFKLFYNLYSIKKPNVLNIKLYQNQHFHIILIIHHLHCKTCSSIIFYTLFHCSCCSFTQDHSQLIIQCKIPINYMYIRIIIYL